MFTGIGQSALRHQGEPNVNTLPVLPFANPTGVTLDAANNNADLRDAAKKLEATFLSEMLKAAGMDKFASGFGGGIGQEQFASFLRDAQATEMVEAGGIGLAESLFNAMRDLQNAA